MTTTPDGNDDATITRLATTPCTVAVVGLSPKPHRASYDVAQYLQRHGWRIVPVNPAAAGSQILGEPVYASLTEAARAHSIALVDVFRNSDDVPPVVDEALALGLPAIWLQLGIAHPQAAAKARAAGVDFVQNLCLKVEHAQRA
jgi:predicted CoA-binding protein